MPKKKQSSKSKKRAGSPPAKPARKATRRPSRTVSRRAPSKPAVKPARKPTAKSRPVRKPKAPAAGARRRPGKKPTKPTTVADILNLAKAPVAKRNTKRIATKWKQNYHNLVRLRDELLVQSGQLARDAHEESVRHSMHMADSGTDSFDRDFALSLLSADQEAIREIEEAMKRIENGTYGICEMTGKPIAKARLAAIPWARFSYEAQCRLEKEGQANLTHLGSLGSIYTSDNWESGEAEEEEEEPQASSEKS